MNRIIVGLTGGICSGKSRACEMFAALGCDVIDADIISKEITADGTEVSERIAEKFPDALTVGVIDRRKLKNIVFRDGEKLELLNSLTHPPIMERMKKDIASSKSDIVILAVPLLFETGFDILADVCVTVSSSEETRIQRLVKRDNIDRELAKKIIAAQMSDEERESRADTVIRNDGSEEELAAKVKQVFGILSSKVNENKNRK